MDEVRELLLTRLRLLWVAISQRVRSALPEMRFYEFRDTEEALRTFHYIIVSNTRLQQRLSTALDPYDGLFPFRSGRSLTISGRVPVVMRGEGAFPPILLGALQGLYVATAIGEQLKSLFPNLIQLFELESTDPRAEGLLLVNVMRKLDCIDYERSTLDLFLDPPRRCRAIWKLVFKQEAIGPDDVSFWLDGTSRLVFTESGKRAWISTGIPDECFAPLDVYES